MDNFEKKKLGLWSKGIFVTSSDRLLAAAGIVAYTQEMVFNNSDWDVLVVFSASSTREGQVPPWATVNYQPVPRYMQAVTNFDFTPWAAVFNATGVIPADVLAKMQQKFRSYRMGMDHYLILKPNDRLWVFVQNVYAALGITENVTITAAYDYLQDREDAHPFVRRDPGDAPENG